MVEKHINTRNKTIFNITNSVEAKSQMVNKEFTKKKMSHI